MLLDMCTRGLAICSANKTKRVRADAEKNDIGAKADSAERGGIANRGLHADAK